MSDVAGAPSDGASDSLSTSAEAASPSASPREAIDRAFDSVFEAPAETAETKAARARDEAGRFAAGETKPADNAKPAEATAQPSIVHPGITPPSRFSKAAQDAYAAVPEVVRQETERAINELTAGIDKYKASAEAFEPLRRFDEMAKAGGTTLDKAVERYVGMEQAWRQDPARGFALVCQNMGVDPVALAQHVLGQLGADPDRKPTGDSPEVAALKREIGELKQSVTGLGQTFEQQRQAPIVEQVTKFAQEAKFFDLLAPDIAAVIQSKEAATIEAAYDAALQRHPELLSIVQAERAAKAAPAAQPDAAQTRKATLSITGSPSGSNPSTRKPAGSAREAIDNAFSQVGL